MHVSPVAQRGVVALMAVLFLLFILGVVLVIAHQMAATDVHDSGAQNLSVEAVFLAESGLERARRRFFDGTACTALGVDGPHNLGQGSFTVNSGATTDFDGITALPVNQCRVQVTGRITATNVARTIEGVIQMGVKVQKGSFTKIGVTGAQTIAGVGFQPRAVIFFWTRQTATGYVANESMGFGFASGAANQRSVAIISDDNANSSDFKRNRSGLDVILMLEANQGAGSTLRARASFVSFNADGFQINWGVNENFQHIIHYIALGGDVTNAFVGEFTASTATGNQAVAGVGFQPDAVLFLNSTIIAAASEGNRTVYDGKHFNLGMMNSAGQQWALSACGRDNRNDAAHSRGRQRVDRAIAAMTDNTCPTTAGSLASFVSMNAGGFTINWSNATGVAFPIFYLALRGGQHGLGSFDQATAAGDQPVVGTGFNPGGLFLASFNRVANIAIAPESEVSLGAASGTLARGAIWSESLNVDLNPGAARTDANMATVTNRIIRLATSQTTNAEADLASFDSNGFTLNWTADATARQILYWAVGSGAPVVRWRELP